MNELLNRHQRTAALAKNPLVRRPLTIIAVIYAISVTGVFAFLSWLVKWYWLKVVLCYISAAFFVRLMLGVVFSVLPFRVPSRAHKPLGAFLAIWITVAIYFVSNQKYQLLIAGGIALALMSPLIVTAFWQFFTEWYFPRDAHKEYLKGKTRNWGRNGLVVAEPGTASHYARKLMKEFLTTLSFVRGDNHFFLFTMMDSIRRFPLEFQQMAIRSVPALLVVRKAYGDNDSSFQSTVQSYINASSGLIFDVWLVRPGDELAVSSGSMGVETIPFVLSNSDSEQTHAKTIAAVIDDQLKRTGIPIGESDDKLQNELRPMVSMVATRGFQPLANCYLRFRLSKSDVERFLCLLDCVEVLIKVSAVSLLVNQWERHPSSDFSHFDEQLRRPSLGIWIDILRKLVAVPGEDALTQTIRVFWKERLPGAPRQLVSDANGSGLAYEGALPRSHLGWLEWFVWLRNRTRGHGAVEESQVSPLWHGLHETFLRMALGLKPLVADSAFAVLSQDGIFVPCSGWNRNVRSASSAANERFSTGEPVFFVNGTGAENRELLVYPFLIKNENATWVWNSVRKDEIEYLDYGTGKMLRVQLDETNPHRLWESGNRDFQSRSSRL